MINTGAKKRQRPNKSCTACREKKIRCDRAKPTCASCVKRKQPELCLYEGPAWSVKVGEDDYISTKPPVKQTKFPSPTIEKNGTREAQQSMKQMNGIGLEHSGTNVFQPMMTGNIPGRPVEVPTNGIDDFPSNNLNTRNSFPQPFEKVSVSNLISHHGGSSHTSTPRSRQSQSQAEDDPDEDTISFHAHSFGEPTILGQGIFTWVTSLKRDIYCRSVLIASKKERIIFANVKKGRKDGDNFAKKFLEETDIDKTSKESVVKYSIPVKNKDISNSLTTFLSNRKLVWILIDKFFDSELYSIFPILWKEEFMTQIISIIGERGDMTTFNFTKRTQLANIGILLVVMRLSSLTAYNAGKSVPDDNLPDDDKYIKDHPITKDAIELARSCLDEILMFKEAHLLTFQFNLFMLHYQFYGPEDCDCVSSAAISSMGPLMHSAIALGLNRDPSISHPNYKNPELLRRLWYMVVYLDYYQLILVGYPPLIDHDFHDVKLPQLNHNDPAMQYSIHEMFHNQKEIFDLAKPLMLKALNLKEKSKVKDILRLLKPIEDFFEHIPKPDDIIKVPSHSVMYRVQKLKMHHALSDTFCIIFTMYQTLFLHYSAKGNGERALHYTLELLRMAKILYPGVQHFKDLGNSGEHLDINGIFGCSILAIPKMELCLHKICEFLMSYLSRVKSFKALFSESIDEEVMSILDAIGDLLFKTLFYLLEAFASVSDVYYHAWTLTKIQSYIIQKILSNSHGKIDKSKLSKGEQHYIETLKNFFPEDNGLALFNKQDLKQILNELELLDMTGLGQTPSPERLLNDLNSYKSKNDQLWFDQLMFESNFHYQQNSGSKTPQKNIFDYTGLELNDIDSNSSLNSIENGFFELDQLFHQSTRDF